MWFVVSLINNAFETKGAPFDVLLWFICFGRYDEENVSFLFENLG